MLLTFSRYLSKSFQQIYHASKFCPTIWTKGAPEFEMRTGMNVAHISLDSCSNEANEDAILLTPPKSFLASYPASNYAESVRYCHHCISHC